jgi:Na+-transporting methylmalonyl-CoA/oxaloacetate decarboxylase beta subunit
MEGFFQTGFGELIWGNVVMLGIGLAFIWLAITKKWEPYELAFASALRGGWRIRFGRHLGNIY